jgi:hypothetical protein
MKGAVASKPILAQGAEFVVSADSVWHAPKNRGRTKIDLRLTITNRDAKPQAFSLFDTVRMVLKDTDGKDLRIDGGRNGTRPGKTTTPLLAKDASYVVHLSASLLEANGALRLQGDDGFGGIWYFDGLRAGKYSVSVHYDSTLGKAQSNAEWRGTVNTQSVVVEIR